MAVKKVVASLDAVKTETAAKAETVKTEVKKAVAPAKEAVKKATAPAKEAAKKAAAPVKEAVKKAAAPAKETAKKAPAKKAAAKASKATAEIKLQFADKEYTQEDLVKIANDVWVYDYDKKASELKKIQLFVKPEESKVYYVFNDDITGAFDI